MTIPDDVLAGASLVVYVEDNADTIWRVWFPPENDVRFVNVGGKAAVKRRVRDDIRPLDRRQDPALQSDTSPSISRALCAKAGTFPGG